VIKENITEDCSETHFEQINLFQANLDLGTDPYGFGYGGTGKKSNNRQFDDYGTPFGLNDVIGCALDLDNGIISYHKNGMDLGNAFIISNDVKNKGLFPAVVLKVFLFPDALVRFLEMLAYSLRPSGLLNFIFCILF